MVIPCQMWRPVSPRRRIVFPHPQDSRTLIEWETHLGMLLQDIFYLTPYMYPPHSGSSTIDEGDNSNGQLGQGSNRTIGHTKGTMGSFLQPIDLGKGRKALAVTAGSVHTCAGRVPSVLLYDYACFCWG